MTTTDPRADKAVDIAATARTWKRLISRDGEVIFGMPSQSTPGLYYLVTETTCTCRDHDINGLRPARMGMTGDHLLCKHLLAVHLVRIQQEAATKGLVLERLPSGEFAWLKAEQPDCIFCGRYDHWSVECGSPA
jgi:hypothetical protein